MASPDQDREKCSRSVKTCRPMAQKLCFFCSSFFYHTPGNNQGQVFHLPDLKETENRPCGLIQTDDLLQSAQKSLYKRRSSCFSFRCRIQELLEPGWEVPRRYAKPRARRVGALLPSQSSNSRAFAA